MTSDISDLVTGQPKVDDLDFSLFPGTLPFHDAGFFEKSGYRFQLLRADQIDERQVREIINSGFSPESLVDNYFGNTNESLFLLEENGKSVAVIHGRLLDVLARHRDWQRNGVGTAAFEVYLDLVGNRGGWRSKPERPMNRTYGRRATQSLHGSGHRVQYNHYTIGLSPEEERAAHALMYFKPNNFDSISNHNIY